MKHTQIQTTSTRFFYDDEGPSCQAVLDVEQGRESEIYLVLTVPEEMSVDEIETWGDWEEKDPPFEMGGYVIYTLSLLGAKDKPLMERYGFACTVAEKIIAAYEQHFSLNQPAEITFDAPKTLQ